MNRKSVSELVILCFGLVFGVSGLVFGVSGLIFWVSGLVFWVSELILWVSGRTDGRTRSPAGERVGGRADMRTDGLADTDSPSFPCCGFHLVTDVD